ncbi:hypothetical protein FOXB_05022 [Fusarium oxysporum f. sp. conglutinans Fo5176]|uniref:Rhodopsin domain-containing protein n=1 Tax=Fusarium oxysporum (strain Fo5176) TaxID=660025 RepID=F9FF43_FUSOF|nr:hypothetical protein FOXB_05022 [Fusarium oxysporum f. sp. conglutinans Fo5176]
MLISVGIAIQAVLLGLALFTAILRCWTRLYYERKKLTLSEYFACIGWIFALGWFITSTVSMLILVHHPPAGPDLLIPSVDYQKRDPYQTIDLILFCFPFFILKHLTLRTEQKLGLVGVFSLGAITMSVSLARFIISNAADYQLDYPSGNALCMAEMATAVVVVCLPGLKKLIMRSRTPTNTTSQGFSSKQSSSSHSSNMRGSKSRTASQAYAEWGVMDDEIELATQPQQSHLPGELQDVGKLL